MATQLDPKQRAENVAKAHGHWLEPWKGSGDPVHGAIAYARCQLCNGTVEIREDGSLVGPVWTDCCPMQKAAELEQAEGIADFYADLESGD